MADLAYLVTIMVMACLAIGPLAILASILGKRIVAYVLSVSAIVLGIYWIAVINWMGIIPIICAIYAIYRSGYR